MPKYTTVGGVKYDKAIVDLVNHKTKDGAKAVTKSAATQIWKAVKSDDKVSPVELRTLEYIMQDYALEPAARDFLSAAMKEGTGASGGTSYYKIIDGVKYDRSLLVQAEMALKDGVISLADAEALWEAVQDGPGVTDTESRTLQYVVDHFACDSQARLYMQKVLASEKACKPDTRLASEPDDLEPARKKSYYKAVAGQRYDRNMLETAEAAITNGPMGVEDAKKVWELAVDGQGVTEIEQWTIQNFVDELAITPEATRYLKNALATYLGNGRPESSLSHAVMDVAGGVAAFATPGVWTPSQKTDNKEGDDSKAEAEEAELIDSSPCQVERQQAAEPEAMPYPRRLEREDIQQMGEVGAGDLGEGAKADIAQSSLRGEETKESLPCVATTGTETAGEASATTETLNEISAASESAAKAPAQQEQIGIELEVQHNKLVDELATNQRGNLSPDELKNYVETAKAAISSKRDYDLSACRGVKRKQVDPNECWDFTAGYCSRGSRCRYAHDQAHAVDQGTLDERHAACLSLSQEVGVNLSSKALVELQSLCPEDAATLILGVAAGGDHAHVRDKNFFLIREVHRVHARGHFQQTKKRRPSTWSRGADWHSRQSYY